MSPSLDMTIQVRSLVIGGISRPYAVTRSAGGKAVNAARVAARLGAEVRLVAMLGGPTGESVAALLAADAPSIALDIVTTDVETRTCVSISADDAEGLTELYEPAAHVSDWGAIGRAIEAVEPGEWLVVSGSIPAGVDLLSFAAQLRTAVERGVLVALDTHGPALAALLPARPALVKVNRAEATGLLCDEPAKSDVRGTADDASGMSARALAVTLSDRTGGLVVITDGIAGSVASGPHVRGSLFARPDPEVGRYPVGSGDSVLGALVATLEKGATLAEALARGAAAGSANAALPGAARFSLKEFEAARKRIVVDRVGV